MSTTYLEAVLDGGIQNPNFFNGRVLTAQDLRDEQEANRQRAHRLGQVFGEGVAYGLFVTPSTSGQSLEVSAGLAVNARGDALLLPSAVLLPLTGVEAATAGQDSPFAPCAPPGATVTGNVSAGLYLLAITSATGLRGLAPTTSLNGTSATCVSRYEVEGVQLKLISVPPLSGTEATLRSQLVAACFGTEAVLAAAPNPLSAPPRYGLVDDLRAGGALSDCDTPLAVLRWHSNTVQFVDVWAVRRPCALATGLSEWPLPATPDPLDEPWPQHATPRRRVEGQAFFLQFQEQLERLRTALDQPETAAAATHFQFLPSAGYLPLPATGRKGFQWPAFFGLPATPEPVEIDPAFLREIIHRSFFVDAIPVQAGSPVAVDLFTVMDADPSQPVVLFTRRQRFPATVPPPEEEPPQPPQANSTLLVLVTDPQGRALPAEAVSEVIATDASGKSYRGTLYSRSTGAFISDRTFEQARREAMRKTSGSGSVRDVITGDFERGKGDASFIFHPLPAGRYTVRATPVKRVRLRANSAAVTLPARGTRTLVLRLRPARTVPPDPCVVKPPDRWVLDRGWTIDKGYLNPEWRKPGPMPPDGGFTDPPPPEWRVNAPNEVVAEIEEVLAGHLEANPRLAASNPQVYVRPDYAPNQVYEQPYAYVGTQDGTYYPMILVSGEHTLVGDVSSMRSELRDIEPSTHGALLRINCLDHLDAITGAWSHLLTDILRIDVRGVSSLVDEARDVAKRLQGSFERYPGIDPEASGALASRFPDDVALANAIPEEILNTLGGLEAGYTLGFATRLVDRARQNVPEGGWSLEGLNLGTPEREALEELGVDSRGALLDRATDDAGRDALKGALGLDDSSLDRVVNQAQAGMVAAGVRLTPDAGIASVPGVTSTRAAALVAVGFGTATSLANADRTTVADQLGISVAEAGNLVDGAMAATGNKASVDNVPGISPETATALKDQGIHSAGDLLRADVNTISGIVGSDVLGSRLHDAAGRIAGRGSLRFR